MTGITVVWAASTSAERTVTIGSFLGHAAVVVDDGHCHFMLPWSIWTPKISPIFSTVCDCGISTVFFFLTTVSIAAAGLTCSTTTGGALKIRWIPGGGGGTPIFSIICDCGTKAAPVEPERPAHQEQRPPCHCSPNV